MSIDNDVREAFERHADDVHTRGDAWAGVQRRIERSHRRRLAVSAFVAGAVVASLVVGIPRLFSRQSQPVVPPPIDTAGWTSFQNATDGYRLIRPSDWGVVQDREFTIVLPPDPDRDPSDKPTFSLVLSIQPGNFDDVPGAGTRPDRKISRGALPAGPAYVRVEQRVPGANVSVRYLIDWTTPLCPPGAPCPRPATGEILDVNLSASSPALWTRFGPTSERIVTTITPIQLTQPSPLPSPMPLVVQAKIPVSAGAITAGSDAIWAASSPEQEGQPGVVSRIDPRTNRVVARLDVGPVPRALAGDADGVWLVNGLSPCSVEACGDPPVPPQPPRFPEQNSVMRIDPGTNTIVASIPLNDPHDVAVGAGAVWVTYRENRRENGLVARIDPATNRVVATINVGATQDAASVAVGEGAVWVVAIPAGDSTDEALLSRIDPATNRVTKTVRVPTSNTIPSVATGSSAVWVTSISEESASGLARIDPSSLRITASITLPDAAPVGLGSVATGEGYVWAGGGRGTFWKVDPATNRPVADGVGIGDELPAGVGEIVTAFDSVWVATGDGKIWRITP